MANHIDFHGPAVAINRIDHAVVADSQPPQIRSPLSFRQPKGRAIVRQSLDSR